MLESLAEWMGYPLYYAFDGAPPPPRSGAAHATIAPYGPYATADGTVMLGVQNEREWQAFCTGVLQQPALAADPRFASGAQRNAHRDALRAGIEDVLQGLLAGRGAGAAGRRADRQRPRQQHGRPVGPPAAGRARGAGARCRHPAAPSPRCCPRARNGSFEARMDAVPAVGQHTEAILRELGRTDADIDTLRVDGAI
jgi:itaconate CoA-transferase